MRGLLCSLLTLRGPASQSFAVSFLVAQTPGGSGQYPAVAAAFHAAAVEKPVGCSCPEAEPSASPVVTSGFFRLAGAEKVRLGVPGLPSTETLPHSLSYTLLFDKSQRTEKFLRSYSLSSAERLFTSWAARCDYILIPVQNSRLSHHHSFPLHSICIVLQSENGAHGWPLRCLVLTADATRKMISQSFHGVWPRVTGN